MAAMAARETLPDGSIRLTAERGSMTLARVRPGVVRVQIAGYDRGEFGDAPFDFMQAEIQRWGKIELFVDVTETPGAVTAVRETWTEWFRVHRKELVRVHAITGSTFVETALGVAKTLSRTGELMQLYSDREGFDRALKRAAKGTGQ
jgi:hypothetical protein